MKLTISGTLGSGKSTVAQILAENFGLKRYQSGGFMRKMAEERGMTLNELQLIAENDKSVDDEIDNRQIALGKKENNFIMEARLGYHFIPDSFKIYLKTSVEVAAERIMLSMKEKNEEREKEGLKKNKKEIIQSLIRRRLSEKQRYLDYYDIDYEDESNYDLVIDTSNIDAQEVSEKIIKKVKEHYQKH